MHKKHYSDRVNCGTKLKVMTVAALAGLAFAAQDKAFAQAYPDADNNVPTDVLSTIDLSAPSPKEYLPEASYGTENGLFEKYYKYEDTGTGYYTVTPVDNASDADLTVKYGHPDYDWDNPITTGIATNVHPITQEEIDHKVFKDVTNYHGLCNLRDYETYDLNADFVNIHPNSAFYNYTGGKINNVNGDFVDNDGTTSDRSALMNRNTIHKIDGTFLNNINNNAGAAIFNCDNARVLEYVIGTFVNNSSNFGGAIENWTSNKGKIDHIDALFIGNKARYNGGAISNYEQIDNINSTFIDNTSGRTGGAIYNSGNIDNITSDFYLNHADISGGAIYSHGDVSVQGNFKYNVAGNSNAADYAQGGAIYTSSDNRAKIKGYFDSNVAVALNNAQGGAVSNSSNMELEGTFKNNQAISNGLSYGGAVYSSIYQPTDVSINNSTFENNSAISAGDASGGAVYSYSYKNFGTVYDVPKDKIEYLYVDKYTLVNVDTGEEYSYYSKPDEDYIEWILSEGKKVVVEDYNRVINVSADEIEEARQSFDSYGYSTDGSIDLLSEEDYAKVVSQQTIVKPLEMTNVSFTGNYTKSYDGEAHGGAIYAVNDLTITAKDGYVSKISGNYAEDANGKRREGIYVDSPEQTVTTKLNGYTLVGGTKSRLIYEDVLPENSGTSTLTLNATNNGTFVIDDQIVGSDKKVTVEYRPGKYYTESHRDETGNWVYTNHYVDDNNNEIEEPETQQIQSGTNKLKLRGDSTGKIYLNNDVKNLDIEHNDVTTYVNAARHLNQPDALNSLTMNSGTMNIGSIALAPVHFETFGMNGGTINIDSVDVDLANKTMGRITANNYAGEGKGTINVKAMNIISDAKDLITPVEFADKSFKNTVKSNVKEAYTPIYRYEVEYDTEQKYNQENDNGYFVFKRFNKKSPTPVPVPTPENYNPAVYSSAVVAQAGGSTAMQQAMMFAFEHGDTFMNLSAIDRFAKANDNLYALSTDFNDNLYYDFSHENKSVWVKPYSVFESINLKNGPKVDTISYGTLVGFDSNIHKMKKGWYNVGTAYLGYNGSQIDYKGVDASTNGGLLGLTETFYKGNFWTALTATAGAGVAEAHTMYGKDDMTMLMAGIGSKTGYNFEFADGKFIVQPRMFLSYSMVKTLDYTNAAGVRIDSDPMHTIQLNPAIKFIGNTKNGWQPYASVGMVWNLLNETEVNANGVKLPEMHTKPYVEYGVGLQKLWNDKYSAYGQAMVRNGGRTGIALTLGFRMALGNEGKRPEMTQKTPLWKRFGNSAAKQLSSSAAGQLGSLGNDGSERKVLKQLSPTQKAHLMQTTRTSMNGVVR